MATDLSKIPGLTLPPTGRGRRGARARRRPGGHAESFRPGSWNRGPRLRRRSRVIRTRREVPWASVAIAVMFLVIGAYLAKVFWDGTRVGVVARGLDGVGIVNSQTWGERVVTFDLDQPDRAKRAVLALDGEPVRSVDVTVEDGSIAWRAGSLGEGVHEVSLSVPRPILGDSRFVWSVTVDDTPPRLEVDTLQPAVAICQAVTVEGSVEPGTELVVNGEPVASDDGSFRLSFDGPPPPLSLVATDTAGNATEREVIVPVDYPGGQGVHVTAIAWSFEPLRSGIIELIDAGLVSVVELDLKDEGGVVGYDSALELANRVGAVEPAYSLAETVADLESRGVRVVGRIVAFRDQKLADWAWENGRRDWVAQTPEGERLSQRGHFVNIAHPEVQQYNLDIALEAVDAGVDDILWDYVRRPEGDPARMVFTGMEGSPADTVVGFMAKTHAALRERCAYQGASVFGIAADRPDAVGQDVPRLARHMDYMSPMVYPSHWVPGEYRVEDPNRQPGLIVGASLADFQAKTAGTGITLMPWLQDFSDGVAYGPTEVRDQIDAARALGIDDWLLWNAGVEYTAEALDPALVSHAGAPRP